MNAHTSVVAMATAQQAEVPQNWNEAYAAYRKAKQSQKALLDQLDPNEDIPDDVVSMGDVELASALLIPAPSLDALAIKLALFAADEGHGLKDAAVFQARMTADALRFAYELSGMPELRDIAAEQAADATHSLSLAKQASHCDPKMIEQCSAIESILAEVVRTLSNPQHGFKPRTETSDSATVAALINEGKDEEILTAWKAARAIPLPDRGEDEMGQLEMVMARKVAKTIPGVLAQLWTSVDHMAGQQKSDWLREALDQDNFGTIILRRAELDFDIRMVVQAIHGLSQMAACQAGAGPDRRAWNAALAEYRLLRQIADDEPGHPEEDNRVTAWCEAQDHLIENVRVPDHAALRIKLDLIHERMEGFCDWPDSYREGVNLDIAHLACKASACNDHRNASQLRAWLTERDALMAWMNGKDTPNPGGTEEERDRATWLENAIFGAKATTAEDAYLKLLLASKISADGASLSDEDSAALVAEAERFLPAEALTAASTPVARMANLIKRIYDLQDEADDIESAGILPSGTMSEPLLRVSIEAGHAICTIPPTSVEDCAQLMDHAVTIAEFVSDNQDERDGLKAPSKAVLSALRGAATRLAPSAALAHA